MAYMTHRYAAATALILVTGIAGAKEPAAVAYRPTVSNPAELSEPGWLDMEAGWARNTSSSMTRQALPYTAKLAFNRDWGVMMAGELYVREDSGAVVSGRGDTTLTLKHYIATSDEAHNFGIEAGVNLPTAATGLGSGKSDWTVNGIYSLDFAENWRLDANAGLTRYGAPENLLDNTSTLYAAALSRNLGAWTLAGEISRFHQGGDPNSTQWLVAASYAVSPRTVLDAGFSRTRKEGEDLHALFFGVTWLVGKVF